MSKSDVFLHVNKCSVSLVNTKCSWTEAAESSNNMMFIPFFQMKLISSSNEQLSSQLKKHVYAEGTHMYTF